MQSWSRWDKFVVIATIVGFIINLIALWDMSRNGDHIYLWLTAGIVLILLLMFAVHWLRTSQGPKRLAWILAASTILSLILGVVVWLTPPRVTTVLIANFEGASDAENIVTGQLTSKIEELLADFDTIRVVRLWESIPAQGGRKKAIITAAEPQYKATSVIWGQYANFGGNWEIHAHFEIVRNTDTYLGTGFYEGYNQLQLQQPNSLTFRFVTGEHLANVIALMTGLILFSDDRYDEAGFLFDSAAQAIGQPIAVGLEPALWFYRGTNHLMLRRLDSAAADLRTLLDYPPQVHDELWITEARAAAAHNLAIIAIEQNNLNEAQPVLAQATNHYQTTGNTAAAADSIRLQGFIAEKRGEWEQAKESYQTASQLYNEADQTFISLDRGRLARKMAEQYQNDGLSAEATEQFLLAKHHLQSAADGFNREKNRLAEAVAYGQLGRVEYGRGNLELAAEHYSYVQTLFQQIDEPLGVAKTHNDLGWVSLQQNQCAEALEHYQTAFELFQQLQQMEHSERLWSLLTTLPETNCAQNAPQPNPFTSPLSAIPSAA